MEDTERQGGRVRAPFVAVLAAGLFLNAPIAGAVDFRLSDDDFGWGGWGEISFSWNTRLTAGVQVRTERRDSRLIDKQNLRANQDKLRRGRLYNRFQEVNPAFFPIIHANAGVTNPIPGSGPLDPETGEIIDFEGRYDLCEIMSPGWWDRGFANFGYGDADCFSAVGDPRPSMRLINAPGGYNINGDDGNLNYDRGDITYANFQVRSELTAHWRDLTVKVSGIGYYDPVNNDFDTHLADRGNLEYFGRSYRQRDANADAASPDPVGLFDAAYYPVGDSATVDRSGFTQRQDDEEDRLGEQLRLLEAFVAYDFKVGDRTLRIGIGDQRMRWGESTFMIFNNLARINPPSAELYDRPGTEVRDAFIPVGMVTGSMNLTTNLNIEAFYQYDWEPVEPSVCGSFLSFSDVAGCGDGPTPIYLASGNAPEAPNAGIGRNPGQFADFQNSDFRLGGLSGAQTNTSRTIYLEDEAFGYPEDGGQYGLRIDYYADWLNGGTELSFYGMNIHSRLPFFSVKAAGCSATRGEAMPYQDDPLVTGGVNCPFSDFGAGGDGGTSDFWYRADSLRAFLDYPEDIKIFGFSGTTNLGDWSLAGEVAYSPNQPAQVSQVDVVYAGLQPAFFRNYADSGDGPYDDGMNKFHAGPSPVAAPVGAPADAMRETPVARVAIPDYLMSRYRCDISDADFDGMAGSDDWENELACSQAIDTGEYIRGYERLQVGQISLTGIRVFGGSNPISADQIIFVGEFAATNVFDMPDLDQLQFQGASASLTHYSQGQAEWNPGYGPFVFQGGSKDVTVDGGTRTVNWAANEPILDENGDLRDKFALAFGEDFRLTCNQSITGTDTNPETGGCYRKLGPTDRINPERADEDQFADDFAMGYRMRLTADYNNGPFGWKWTPGFTFYHDVYGNSIYPGQDFVEDRKRLTLHTNVLFTNNFSGNFQYRFYWGAGDRNLRLDRDYAELSLSYAF